MKYISTRGRTPAMGFADVTLAGLASDGGLFVPENLPPADDTGFHVLTQASYHDVAAHIMQPYVGQDIVASDLRQIIDAAYTTFTTPDIVPLKQLTDNFFVMEMFHGPTLAFKDLAMQFLGHLFDHLLARAGQNVTIIGATSGDTGSAAIQAFAGKTSADIFILHPKGRISEVQRRQMTTVQADNVHNIALEGSFDDCQNLVKALFADEAFRRDMALSAVNSINWARLMAQIVYYVYAAVRLKESTGQSPAFCVPSGNFGNIYAGYIAKRMGAPIHKLLVATNANDILYRFFATTRMQREDALTTLSPSMDIQVSSNFERLLFEYLSRHGEAVGQTMNHFSHGGAYHVEESVMEQMRTVFGAGRKDDDQTLTIMKKTWEEQHYLVDPHTAVGMGVAQDYCDAYPETVMVSLATAHPAKFPDAVQQATGQIPALPEHMMDLYDREEKMVTLPADETTVKEFMRKHARTKAVSV